MKAPRPGAPSGVTIRDHDVDARFARRVNDRFGKTVSLERLIRDRGEMD